MCGKYKNINYDSDSGSALQLYFQSSPEEGMVSLVRMVSLVEKLSLVRKVSLIRKGKFGQNSQVHLALNVNSFAHNGGCVVNGSNATTAI